MATPPFCAPQYSNPRMMTEEALFDILTNSNIKRSLIVILNFKRQSLRLMET